MEWVESSRKLSDILRELQIEIKGYKCKVYENGIREERKIGGVQYLVLLPVLSVYI